jgi:energy-coupling factor transport system permease protein
MILAVSTIALLIGRLLPMSLLFVLVVLLAGISGIFTDWSRTMTKTAPFFVIVIVLDAFFTKATSGTLYYAGDFWILHPRLTSDSILYSLTMGFRLLSFVGISTLFIMSTKYEDFVKGLRKLMVPYSFSFSLSLALRSITYLSSDVRNILDAQRSRGLEIDKKDLIKNYQRFLALFVPMIVCLLLRSKNISEAMQVRAFGHTRHPTMFKGPRLRRVDYGFVLAIVITSIVLLLGVP